jgi:hypothetical protein
VMTACKARREAVINAARISGIPVMGNLLGGDVSRFKLDFFDAVFVEEGMLHAAEQRKARRTKPVEAVL